MISTILLAIGLVLAVEGLVFALAPSRLEEVLKMLLNMPLDQRRMIGLVALGAGVGLVWLSKLIV